MAVFKMVGTHAHEIKLTDSYKTSNQYVKSMYKLFKDKDILNGVLENLTKLCSKKEIIDIFCFIMEGVSKSSIKEQWSDIEMAFSQEMKKLTDSISVLNAIQCHVSDKIRPAGIKIIRERLEKLQKDVQNGQVTAKMLQGNKSFWEELTELPDLCTFLYDCVKSKVFWTSCKEAVENKFDEELEKLSLISKEMEPYESSISGLFADNTTESSDEEQDSQDTFLLLKILSGEGIGAYKNAWTSLIKDQDKHVSFVLRLLHGVDIDEEIESAEKVLHERIPLTVKKTLSRLKELARYEETVEAMKKCLSVFRIDLDESDSLFSAITAFERIRFSKDKDCPFSLVIKSLEKVDIMSKMMSNETLCVLNELSQSSSLVEFLMEIVDEDIRNLIDAVDCISEQQVQATTVSALIDVKSFLHGILVKVSQGLNAHDFISSLNKQVQTLSTNAAKQLPSKIHDCRSLLHNLKSLYGNVANRGAMTIEVINNITTKGKFTFKLQDSVCSFHATYKHGNGKEEHSKTSLMDLRSRALLLMNTSSKPQTRKISSGVLERFVNYVDLSVEIAEVVSQLHQSGNIRFMSYQDQPTDCQGLSKKRQDLLQRKEEWDEMLKILREKYYLLNFVHGPEIHMLYDFFENGTGKEKVITILRYIHPDIEINQLLAEYNNERAAESDWTLSKVMECIGSVLHLSYEGKEPFQRPFHIKTQSKKMTDVVQNRKLFVASLEENSSQVVKTVLALYLNTTHVLPEPHQVLFCTRETTWNELELLLYRCLGSSSFIEVSQLFCIANVESLVNELLFRLVEALKNISTDKDYLLALICRGSSSHPFLDELSSFTGKASLNLSDEEVRQVFQKECPDVVTITSAVPGLGKTNRIKEYAFAARKSLYTLHISGPVHKRRIIDKMKIANIGKRHAIHLDIGAVDCPVDLDTFLFELIILGYVTAGFSAVSLATGHVFIEVGNTINDSVRNSLDTAMYFKRQHLIWQNYDDFQVSMEINSPVQVVCQFLYGIQTGTLDKTDVLFTGCKAVSCLPADVCRILLRKHFATDSELSFSIINIFLQVLADQLKRMSCSTFLRVSQVSDMVGHNTLPTVRSTLVRALTEASREFSSRSIAACRKDQVAATGSSVEDNCETKENQSKQKFVDLVKSRVEGMIRWEDSNHLIFVFHNQNIQTLSPLYRDLKMVPAHIRSLFESQLKRQMQDFTQMDQTQLQILLQKAARTNPQSLSNERMKELSVDYALTPDNLLKMILIMLRVKSQIPVIIMGETGCGKTSLIRYLAAFSDVDFEVMSIHAGIEEQDLVEVISRLNDEALANPDKEKWLFLDEINTSEHIGIIGAAICSKVLHDKVLSPNVVIMGACNPYKLRTEAAVSTAGLTEKVKTDDLSKLVYRVLPLPERMVDYVWDFGSLSDSDEAVYIGRMIDGIFGYSNHLHALLQDLLSNSQQFVRYTDDASYSVSLRDIQRCKTLIKWFLQLLKWKNEYHEVELKSIVLALSICYHSRFSLNEQREDYRKKLEMVFSAHGYKWINQGRILEIILGQQRDILKRMELPTGTAKNTALQENVFVILVCLLNRIPIFLVGKPGCSKSLSMQIIRSNLRGKDSIDDLFKCLPQLYCVSFQGSESSTSDGIIKVFEKAEQYQKSNEKEDVLSVVILDEIGLAEISRFNPLKVLHNLLEPDGHSQPNVAVVGISNWALDASKMNRAIHLSRPDMDVEELYQTGISISESFLDTREKETIWICPEYKQITLFEIKDILQSIAESYLQYIHKLRFKNFHGLRDYYSLVKYVSQKLIENFDTSSVISEMSKGSILLEGLQRNFGGLPSEEPALLKSFMVEEKCEEAGRGNVLKLMEENIKDKLARHLMCITSGESVMSLIKNLLKGVNRDEKVVIFGSHFAEDQTPDYDYRILSRIILCMEQGLILILKDLDNIYGSLYDMLNQNYTIIGKRKHCRIALGHYSNPLCQVHDDFRCIVLVEEGNVDFSDPPFLNRFEKQSLKFTEVMTSDQHTLIGVVQNYVDEFCKIEGCGFSVEYCFPLYSQDLIPSLVYSLRQQKQGINDVLPEQILDDCKMKLLHIVQPDAILRLGHSACQDIRKNAEQLKRQFFKLPIHSGIWHYIEVQLSASGESNQSNCLMTVVLTNSSIHSKISNNEGYEVQVEKLGAFKSEKQLALRLQRFWTESQATVLFLHCSAIEDEKHISLAKTTVENTRANALRENPDTLKHVYMILHLDRRRMEMMNVLPVNFLSGWELVLLDTLEKPEIPLPLLCKMSLYDAVLKKMPLRQHIVEQLFWCFTTIGYQRHGRDIESIHRIIEQMKASPDFLQILEDLVCEYVVFEFDTLNELEWQQRLALDGYALNTSSAYVTALEEAVYSAINAPLSKLVYQMENINALSSYFCDHDSEQRMEAWNKMIHDKALFSIADTPSPSGPECYVCTTADLVFRMPLSKIVYDKIEETKDDFMESFLFVKGKCDVTDNDEMPELVMEELFAQHENIVKDSLPDLTIITYDGFKEDYFQDFANMASFCFATNIQEALRIKIVQWTLSHKVNLRTDSTEELLVKLHASVWIYSSILSAELQLFDTCAEVFNMDENFAELLQTLPAKLQCGEHLKSSSDHSVEHAATMKSTETIEVVDALEDETPLHTQLPIDKEDDILLHGDDGALKQIENIITSTDINDNEDTIMKTNPELESQENGDGIAGICNSEEKIDVHDSDYLEHMDGDHGEEKMLPNEMESLGLQNGVTASDTVSSSTTSEEIVDDKDSQVQLVEFVCMKMIPTESCLSLFKSVSDWNSRVSIILSYALLVSSEPAALHCLRFFQDLISLLQLQPGNPNLTLVCKLADLIKSDENQSLDTEEAFECICELLFCEPIPAEYERRKIMAAYLNRCLACNAETQAMVYFLHLIKERRLEIDNYVDLKPPIHLAMNLEMESSYDESENIYNMLVQNLDDSLEEHPFLVALDQTLNSFQGTMNVDSQLPVLVVDILEEHFDSVIKERYETDFDQIKSDMLSAHIVILECDYGLKFLTAVAYFKAFVKRFGDMLVQNDFQIMKCSSSFDEIRAVLSKDKKEGITLSLTNFIFKSFGKGLLPWKLKRLCESIQETLDYFHSPVWTEDYQTNSLEGNPLFQHVPVGSQRLSDALLEKDPALWEAIVTDMLKTSTKGSGTLVIHSVAMSRFYVPRSYKRQDDTFNLIAERLLQKAADEAMDEANLNLSACLLGVDAFPCPELNLNEESNGKESCIAFFCCSVFAVILASNPKVKAVQQSFLAKCILSPHQLNTDLLHTVKYLPSHQNDNYAAKTEDVILCSCGHRVMQKHEADGEKHRCPVCSEEFPENGEQPEDTLCKETKIDIPFTSHSFAPVTAKLISLFVDICLFGSMALQSCTAQELKSVIGVSEGENVSNCLWKQVRDSFVDLQTLMDMNYRDMYVFLQASLMKLKGLLAMDKTHLQTTEQTLGWCFKFESELEPLMHERYQTVSDLITTQLQHTTIPKDAPELCLNENDVANLMDSDTRTEIMPALFRIQGQPSFASLRYELDMLHKDGSTEDFPFLNFVLNMLPELAITENLLPIVQWHLATVTHIGYRFKKQDCLEMTVQDFIYHDTSEKVRSVLKTRFDNLQKSVSQLLDAEYKLLTPFDRLNDQMKMKDCLLLNNQSTLFKILKELVSIQNSFLDTALVIGIRNNCESLRCLSRGENSTVLPSRSVSEANPSSIVSFHWDEELLKFSHADLTYGSGQNVRYEFAAIEKSLALDLVVGKCYLQLDNTSLPSVVFVDEFYHGFSQLVKEVSDAIPQRELSIDAINGIKAKRNKNPRLTADLMTHVGVLIALVKKTKGDPDQSVIEYVETWKSYLTHPLPLELLPAPEDSIKLCHLVALYGILEELNADSLVDSLSDEYRVSMHRDIEAQLLELLRVKKKEAETILRAAKRFTYRCISSGEVDSSRPLLEYLEDESFWPLNQGPSEANGRKLLHLIPCDLKVQHIHQLIVLMDQKLKVFYFNVTAFYFVDILMQKLYL